MSQNLAVWVLVVLAFVAANLPFLVQRPMFFFPWQLKDESDAAMATRILSFVACTAVYVVVGVAVYRVAGQMFIVSSAALFTLTLAIVAIFAVLLFLPAAIAKQRYREAKKSFVARFIEFLALLYLVGVVGFTYERLYGNVFPQGWEFYAVGLCLFVVLGYPSFVYRYLLKRRRVLVTN